MKEKSRDKERNMKKKEETKETENEVKKNNSLCDFTPILLFCTIHLPLFFLSGILRYEDCVPPSKH